MCKIIVIGAGAAGLAAGQRLRQLGHDVLVLEAQDRIGGRVLTQHSDDGNVIELGAEFIHGEHAATWAAMQAAGQPLQAEDVVEVGQTAVRRIYVLDGRIVAGDSPFANEVERWKDSLDTHQHDDTTDLVSVADWFEQPVLAGDIAALIAQDRIARYEAAPASRLSVTALRREHKQHQSGGRNFRVTCGYDRLINLLAQGLNIRLNTPVWQVNWQADGAEVVTDDGQRLRARHVVVTVPVSLLQMGMLQFNPPLPAAKRRALHALEMGQAYKLVLRFRQAFWPEIDFLVTQGTVQTWWPLTQQQGEAALMSFTAGPAALHLSALGEAGAVARALAELERVFGAVVREQFIGAVVKDWSLDPWARGAYTYTAVGTADARDVLAQPIGPLHFAGEATLSNGHHATVHGAIESGWRVGEEIGSAKS
ncbi:MAG: FAD-dependent oxidoreductase [Anaerolineae bacterium]|nr:FAD-dependent oxidoreductase [Anaerolineae bacterium]